MEKFYFVLDNSLYFGYEDENDAYEIKVKQTVYEELKERKVFIDFEVDKNGYSVLKEFPETSTILEKIVNNEIKTLEEVVDAVEKIGFIEEKDEEEINYDLEPKKKGLLGSVKHFLMLN